MHLVQYHVGFYLEIEPDDDDDDDDDDDAAKASCDYHSNPPELCQKKTLGEIGSRVAAASR
jgi:hypothetical protein